MKRKKVSAYYEGKDYDQSSWVAEKTASVLCDICRAISENGEQDALLSALHDCLKLYSFWSGDEDIYCEMVENFLATHGEDGFLHLEYVAGLSSQKDPLTEKLEDNNTVGEIFELITPHNNRTRIYDELSKLHKKTGWVVKIENDLEFVTQGVENWEWFYERHKNDDMGNVRVDVHTLIMTSVTGAEGDDEAEI